VQNLELNVTSNFPNNKRNIGLSITGQISEKKMNNKGFQ